jgi:hypothetical protein
MNKFNQITVSFLLIVLLLASPSKSSAIIKEGQASIEWWDATSGVLRCPGQGFCYSYSQWPLIYIHGYEIYAEVVGVLKSDDPSTQNNEDELEIQQ